METTGSEYDKDADIRRLYTMKDNALHFNILDIEILGLKYNLHLGETSNSLA